MDPRESEGGMFLRLKISIDLSLPVSWTPNLSGEWEANMGELQV